MPSKAMNRGVVMGHTAAGCTDREGRGRIRLARGRHQRAAARVEEAMDSPAPPRRTCPGPMAGTG